MPESKHRRGGKVRKRAYQTHEPVKNPEPSPTWVPATGVALLVAGVMVILVGYLPPVQGVTQTWPLLGANWGLIGGFLLLTTGFVFLTRWR
jgi:hypothetical protein